MKKERTITLSVRYEKEIIPWDDIYEEMHWIIRQFNSASKQASIILISDEWDVSKNDHRQEKK